jgi:hypothetical protein
MIAGTKTTTPDPILRLIRCLGNDLTVILAANELGYVETALEACLSAKETLQVIRKTLLTPHTMNAAPIMTADHRENNGKSETGSAGNQRTHGV